MITTNISTAHVVANMSVTWLDLSGQRRTGTVLGSERREGRVWVLILDTNEVLETNVRNILRRDGVHYFVSYDRKTPVKKVVEDGTGNIGIGARCFEYSEDEERLLNIVKTYALILPQS